MVSCVRQVGSRDVNLLLGALFKARGNDGNNGAKDEGSDVMRQARVMMA